MFFIVSLFLCLGSIGTAGDSSSVSGSRKYSLNVTKADDILCALARILKSVVYWMQVVMIPSRDCSGDFFLARWSLILALVDEIEFAIFKIEIEVVIGSRSGSGVGLSGV